VWVVIGVFALRVLAELCLAIFDIHDRGTPPPPSQT
jgi:hypothetical protein